MEGSLCTEGCCFDNGLLLRLCRILHEIMPGALDLNGLDDHDHAEEAERVNDLAQVEAGSMAERTPTTIVPTQMGTLS